MEVKILFGSQSGNAKILAYKAKNDLEISGFNAEVLDMKDVCVCDLNKYKNILLIISTWINGEPPENAEEFYDELSLYSELGFMEKIDLSRLNYAVYAIGQNCYGHFCKTGNDFDRFLNSFGAKRMLKIEKADNNFNETFSIWIDKVKNRLKKIEEKDGRKDNFRRMEAES